MLYENSFAIAGTTRIQQVRVLDAALHERQLPLDITYSDESLTTLLDRDATRYQGIIPANFGYKEKVLLHPNEEVDLARFGSEPFTLVAGSSYQLTAWRKDPDNQQGTNPGHVISVHGITVTSDRKLIYGARGGKTATAGMGEAAPGGNLSYMRADGAEIDFGDDPLFQTFYTEALEELCLQEGELFETRIVGVQTDPHFRPTINVIFASYTNLPFQEIDDRHQQAIAAWRQAERSAGKKLVHADARQAAREAGLANIDAWEKDYLVPIHLDQEFLTRCIESRTIPGQSGVPLQLLSASLGDLQVARYLLGQGNL